MMVPLDYFSFDLLLEAIGDGYRARVMASPAGEAKANFDLTALVAATGVQPSGAALFATVFTGEVGDCLSRAWQQAQAEGKGLRLRLRIDDQTPILAALPWETLYWSQQQRFLALSAHSPIVRYLEQPRADPPLAVTVPLHVLALVAAPTDLMSLDSEHEWQLLQAATADLVAGGQLVLERLARPTLASLQDRLRQGDIHLLHFMGHGLFDEQTQRGSLFFENEAGNAQAVAAATLAALLHDQPPRLIFLNACQGATSGAQNVFAGVAQTLVQGRIPAVIAMGAPISDNAAKTLAHTFYKALADGYPADAALTEARKALYAAPAGALAEWATPILFSRAPDNRLFAVQPATRMPVAAEFVRKSFEPETVLIPAGPFWMGSDEGAEHERPRHEATLPAYAISKQPITNAQYADFVQQATEHRPRGGGWRFTTPPADKLNEPVVGVSWHNAVAYCAWLSAQSKRRYRLPSEAEWEKAVQTGIITGEIREWTSTIWGDDAQAASFTYPYHSDGRDSLTVQGVYRIWRGGGIGTEVVVRGFASPTTRLSDLGLRVVLAME